MMEITFWDFGIWQELRRGTVIDVHLIKENGFLSTLCLQENSNVQKKNSQLEVDNYRTENC